MRRSPPSGIMVVADPLGLDEEETSMSTEENNMALARIPSNMFVTCFYCILESEGGHSSYANAGHDLP
jgi:hypothetical protein